MNRFSLWALRTAGVAGCFWFFFWAFIWEMVRWQKPQPDIINTALFVASLLLVALPNFKAPKIDTRMFKPVKPTETSQTLGKQLLDAKPTERRQLMDKLMES